jgi:hypothetical protein
MEKINNLPRVRVDEIGMYLKTIELDYQPKDNTERAELITTHFNVCCLPEDIEHYEMLHRELARDYELTARREGYFRELGTYNPFEE